MKLILSVIALAASATAASAQYGQSYGGQGSGGYGIGSNSSNRYVQPHYNRSSGYVGGHYQTNPNSTTLDNYSTKPNSNPYTGQTGTRRGNLW